jgi:hypothetical protein
VFAHPCSWLYGTDDNEKVSQETRNLTELPRVTRWNRMVDG